MIEAVFRKYLPFHHSKSEGIFTATQCGSLIIVLCSCGELKIFSIVNRWIALRMNDVENGRR